MRTTPLGDDPNENYIIFWRKIQNKSDCFTKIYGVSALGWGLMKDIFKCPLSSFGLHWPYEDRFYGLLLQFWPSSTLWRAFSWLSHEVSTFIDLMKAVFLTLSPSFDLHRPYENRFHDTLTQFRPSSTLWRPFSWLSYPVSAFIPVKNQNAHSIKIRHVHSTRSIYFTPIGTTLCPIAAINSFGIG